MEVTGYFRKIRTGIIFVVLTLMAGYIVASYGKLALKAVPGNFETSVPVIRGSILDRTGKQLAVETSFYHFVVSPNGITDPVAFAKAVSPVLKMNEDVIVTKIKASVNPNFLYLKKKISQSEYEQLRAICRENQFYATRFDRIPGRVYPEHSLASQLIGFMGDDGKGLAGVELSMQNYLAPQEMSENGESVHGKNVFLTIDANLQHKLEKIAKSAIERTQAESMMLLASDVKTGEILSYISLPDCDLNAYTLASAAEKMDRPAIYSFEPGSVFKIFTVATLLESGVIKDTDSFLCDGVYEKSFGKEKIRITCLDHHGWLTARGALEMSCNDALAQMAELANTDLFLSNFRNLGFGERTGIDLPGEAKGFLKDQTDRLWSARSKPTMAIGQELTVTALQMIQATSAIANGGIPVKPSIISRIMNSDGTEVYHHNPVYKKQVLHPETANYLLSCMETVAQRGTGHKASLGDVSIGVKTGTAQMADIKNGGYSKTDYLSDCMAIFPIENPEIILYIVIEKAKGETYAGRIVAPVIREAADAIIDHLGMSRGGAESLAHSGRIMIAPNAQAQLGALMSDFTGKSKRELLQILSREDLTVRIYGDGWVKSQKPAPGTPITKNMVIELYLE